MKRSIDLDDELAAEVDKTASLIHEKPATVLRLAVRAGLSSYNCFMPLSIAAKSWPMVASVSSPMLEIRNVVPLIFP